MNDNLSNTEYKTLPSYEESPFSPEGIVERIYLLKEDEQEIFNDKTGEIFLVRKVPKNKQVKHDSASYTKLFRGEIKIKDFSIPAFNLFYFICSALKPNQKEVIIEEDIFLSEMGYSKGSKRLYYKALTELIDKKILAKKARALRTYWINMNVIYNGDRTKI